MFKTYDVQALTGEDLNRAVLKALGWHIGAFDMGGSLCVLRPDPKGSGWPEVVGDAEDWNPARVGLQATLLADIAGLVISFEAVDNGLGDFVATHTGGAVGKGWNGFRNCRELAICRCLVAARFGDEVPL